MVKNKRIPDGFLFTLVVRQRYEISQNNDINASEFLIKQGCNLKNSQPG